MKQLINSTLIEIVCRLYVFLFLNVYGLGKILGGQFYRKGHLPDAVANQTLGNADGFDIAWTFMGYSSAYIFFIGFSQIIGAWCLLWRKTKLLGVAILFPILVNIIVFDIIFLRGKGPIANASIYLLMLVYILYHNRVQIVQAFQLLTNPASSTLKKEYRFKQVILMVLLFAIIFGLDQFFVNLLGFDRG